jgi:hypothetical protein
MINGFRLSQAIHVAARLGIADLLTDGPRSSEELATSTGSHADTLYRLLRALASAGVLHEDDRRTFSLTAVGTSLRTDVPDSLAGWARFMGRPYIWQSWAQLFDSVQTGENAFRLVHGDDVWSYRAAHPEESEIFDAAMTALTRAANRSLLEAYDFSRFRLLVDVAGGRGALLAALLARYPSMQGILFDLPHVANGARDVFEQARVADRCTIVSGSFFEAVPDGGDAYVLKSILHDWADDEATAILRVCRAAMGPNAKLLIVERTLGSPNEDPDAKFSDLNMLVGPGGRERTREEFEALCATAGFRLEDETPAASGFSVLTATPRT